MSDTAVSPKVSAETSAPSELLQRRVRIVARALAKHQLVGAWGHCSARIDTRRFLVCASQPMGVIGVGEAGTVVHLDQPLPEGVLGEVRIHQQIYARRPEVNGVCRIMPTFTMALSTLHQVPRPRHGVGAFVADCAYWDDPRLLRDDGLARSLAERMGASNTIVMRANGAIAVGSSIEHAMGLAWCLEDTAKIDHSVRSMTNDEAASLLTEQEVQARNISSGRVFERLWQHLTHGDPEACSVDDAFA